MFNLEQDSFPRERFPSRRRKQKPAALEWRGGLLRFRESGYGLLPSLLWFAASESGSQVGAATPSISTMRLPW